MKRLFLLLLSLLTLSLCLFSCKNDGSEYDLNEKGGFSSFVSTDLDGNKVDGSVFRGRKLTMINIWATYCGPCLREMPDLEKLSKEYGDDFQIIGIITDVSDRNFNVVPSQKAAAERILSLTGATYLQLTPSQSLYEIYLNTVTAVPVTVFVDENGLTVGEYVGSRNFNSWKTVIDSMLEKTK